MFRKTKAKIVLTIMLAVTLSWLGTMFCIFISYVKEISTENYNLLVDHAHMYVSSSFLDETSPEKPTESPNMPKPKLELTTFYTVAFSDEGETFETMNDKPAVHSNEELEALAKRIVYEYKRDVGGEGSLVYYHIDKGSYDLVVFIDNTVLLQRAEIFMHYTWIYSAGAFVFFLITSVIIANLIVRPLEKGYKNQRDFISNAGHELKTPVSIINANTELLSREIGNNRWLDNIQYENERMSSLVGNFLDIACMESVPTSMESIDFSRLCQGEALPFESMAFEKGLNLNCDIAPNINILGNENLLKHVVSVLLDNAINHCDNNDTEIKLILKKDFYRYAKLRVINSGAKIPKEERERIFERFYRLNKEHSGDSKHYGLGLSIVKEIITAHKGKTQVLCYDGKVEFQVLVPLNKKQGKKTF